MAYIKANRMNVFFPLSGEKVLSGPNGPRNLIRIGNKPYINALRDISFQIHKGTRVGLIGRNGSGKSTLLRVLGGIYTPTSGTLETSGKISSLFNLNLGVQQDASGRDNILLRGLIKGRSRAEIRELSPEIIEFSELQDFIDFPVRTYSDGMRMRLLFAIATAFSPEILLLDEWIGAGDARFKKKAANRMKSLVEQAGVTVIASHNRNLLREVCDIGVWLDDGVMRAMGEIEQVFEQMDDYYAKHSTSGSTLKVHPKMAKQETR